MRHLRTDYEAIQPWPTKRPHIAKVDGKLVMDSDNTFGKRSFTDAVKHFGDHMDPIIPDDEPVFLLRCTDALAPDVVRRWANALGEAGGSVQLQARVLDWANEMEAYAARHYGGGKTPDVPPGFLS